MTLQGRLTAVCLRYSDEIALVWRYYKVGIINAAFGYGTYALLVAIGLNLYVAQIISTISGICFNYFTFTRHVFHGKKSSVLSFVGASLVNYAVNAALLALFHQMFASPYVAGLLAIVGASITNFFVLRNFIFTKAREGT